MKKGDFGPKKGFTIIEVALVLGIGGLLLLMVFAIVPSISRSQRDAQRREDVTKLVSDIKKYQSNNRGALPEFRTEGQHITMEVVTKSSAARNTNEANWRGFYKKYLGDNFIDPDGAYYELNVMNCAQQAGSTVQAGKQCNNTYYTNITRADFSQHIMYVVLGATCSGAQAVGSDNSRMVAVLYKLEGSGIYCANT